MGAKALIVNEQLFAGPAAMFDRNTPETKCLVTVPGGGLRYSPLKRQQICWAELEN